MMAYTRLVWTLGHDMREGTLSDVVRLRMHAELYLSLIAIMLRQSERGRGKNSCVFPFFSYVLYAEDILEG